MDLDCIAFEPNSSYEAEGRHSMSDRGSMINYQIRITTDEVGRIRSYSDGAGGDPSIADMWDYLKVRNTATGKVWDLRFYNAAISGKVGLAREALAEGADVNLRMKQGATALHWAAAKGKEEVAKLLLEHSADVNAVDELGWTPAFLAAKNGFDSLAELFVRHGAKTTAVICGEEQSLSISEADPEQVLIEACEAGNFEAAKAAIDNGADVNCTSRDGWTPLLIASKEHPRIVELLLANGADPNVVSDRGYSPLMRAAGNGNEEVVTLLLDAGADKNLVDCDGKRAAQLAMEMKQFKCAQMVI